MCHGTYVMYPVTHDRGSRDTQILVVGERLKYGTLTKSVTSLNSDRDYMQTVVVICLRFVMELCR